MSRPKGSKNKPKVGGSPTRDVPKVKKAPKTAPVAPRITENPETGHPLSDRPDAYPEVTQAAIEACLKLSQEYGGKGLPPHVEMGIHAIRLAKDLASASIVKDKAEQRMLVHMLSEWGRGHIPGKVTPGSLQEKIDGALYWAQVNDDNDDPDQAAKQRARATKLQQELDALKDIKSE